MFLKLVIFREKCSLLARHQKVMNFQTPTLPVTSVSPTSSPDDSWTFPEKQPEPEPGPETDNHHTTEPVAARKQPQNWSEIKALIEPWFFTERYSLCYIFKLLVEHHHTVVS